MYRKNISLSGSIFFVVCILLVVSSCVKDTVKQTSTNTYTYTITTPVYATKSEFLASLNGNTNEPVKSAGKLYIKDQFIYLNEVNKGIHVIDNSNPSRPTQIAFLKIPGNLDIAVKGNTLYADTYTDLLAIDISNPKKVTLIKSIANFFQSRIYYNNNNNNLMVVDLKTKDTTVEYTSCANCLYALSNSTTPSANATAAKSNGTAGSMASIVLMKDYLYAIREPHSIGIVNVSTPTDLRQDTTFYAGYDLQTIYPFEDKLFLGSMSGMYMYDMTNPVKPIKLGQFTHGRACDPVVTDGTYAYVTLHAGTTCGGADNELNVVDVKDLMNPALVKTYPLTKPTGLSKDGNLLFVCDDDSGVRLYDATTADNLKQLNKIDITGSYDVIAGGNHLMVVTKNGLYQYDYSDVSKIKQLSVFSLSN
ncbi:MAG: hypothetical protein QM726_09390 [Chitinophagaceae bacterium]